MRVSTLISLFYFCLGFANMDITILPDGTVHHYVPSSWELSARALKKENRTDVIYGDVIKPNKTAKLQTQGSPYFLNGIWPFEDIPYDLESGGYNSAYKDRIRRAIRDYEAHTCLKFHSVGPGFGDSHIRFVQNGRYCVAGTGFTFGSPVEVNVHQDVCSIGSIVHEIGHALAFMHTMSRIDRDRYIAVKTQAFVDTALLSQYAIAEDPLLTPSAGVYDFSSIMHYGKKTNGRDGRYATYAPRAIGVFQKLSRDDIAAVNFMYAGCRQKHPMCITTAKHEWNYVGVGQTIEFFVHVNERYTAKDIKFLLEGHPQTGTIELRDEATGRDPRDVDVTPLALIKVRYTPDQEAFDRGPEVRFEFSVQSLESSDSSSCTATLVVWPYEYPGALSDTHRVAECYGFRHDEPGVCGGRGQCTAHDTCQCSGDAAGMLCEQNFGDVLGGHGDSWVYETIPDGTAGKPVEWVSSMDWEEDFVLGADPEGTAQFEATTLGLLLNPQRATTATIIFYAEGSDEPITELTLNFDGAANENTRRTIAPGEMPPLPIRGRMRVIGRYLSWRFGDDPVKVGDNSPNFGSRKPDRLYFNLGGRLHCKDGYYGTRCQQQCQGGAGPKQCHGGGLCHDGQEGDGSCRCYNGKAAQAFCAGCENGFEGENCEIRNPCAVTVGSLEACDQACGQEFCPANGKCTPDGDCSSCPGYEWLFDADHACLNPSVDTCQEISHIHCPSDNSCVPSPDGCSGCSGLTEKDPDIDQCIVGVSPMQSEISCEELVVAGGSSVCSVLMKDSENNVVASKINTFTIHSTSFLVVVPYPEQLLVDAYKFRVASNSPFPSGQITVQFQGTDVDGTPVPVDRDDTPLDSSTAECVDGGTLRISSGQEVSLGCGEAEAITIPSIEASGDRPTGITNNGGQITASYVAASPVFRMESTRLRLNSGLSEVNVHHTMILCQSQLLLTGGDLIVRNDLYFVVSSVDCSLSSSSSTSTLPPLLDNSGGVISVRANSILEVERVSLKHATGATLELRDRSVLFINTVPTNSNAPTTLDGSVDMSRTSVMYIKDSDITIGGAISGGGLLYAETSDIKTSGTGQRTFTSHIGLSFQPISLRHKKRVFHSQQSGKGKLYGCGSWGALTLVARSVLQLDGDCAAVRTFSSDLTVYSGIIVLINAKPGTLSEISGRLVYTSIQIQVESFADSYSPVDGDAITVFKYRGSVNSGNLDDLEDSSVLSLGEGVTTGGITYKLKEQDGSLQIVFSNFRLDSTGGGEETDNIVRTSIDDDGGTDTVPMGLIFGIIGGSVGFIVICCIGLTLLRVFNCCSCCGGGDVGIIDVKY